MCVCVYITFFTGGEFVMKFVKDPNTLRCSLSLTKEGKSTKVQKTIFSECFYLMAMSELYKATKTNIYMVYHLMKLKKKKIIIQNNNNNNNNNK